MLKVLKAASSQNEIMQGLSTISRMLSLSHADQSRFEEVFPSLNGGCCLYPRLSGLYRDLREPDAIYLIVDDAEENDCRAITEIPGIARCCVLSESPDAITKDWVSVGPLPQAAFNRFGWTPEEGGD